MELNTEQLDAVNPAEVVAGVFLDDMSARDAIAELKLAGFGPDQIGVALSEEGKQAHKAFPSDVDAKHSLLWRLRHSIEHDLHSRGADLSSREDTARAHNAGRSFTELDLKETLLTWGVHPDTVQLLNREVTPNGLLILVHAAGRQKETANMLERNRGILRTAMATQVARTVTWVAS